MHILIIEDEALLALELQWFLEDRGAKSSDIAASETDAVQSALHNPPDLILSDVNLLQGTGPSAVKSIRARLPLVPVIYITGNPLEAEKADPGSPIITKPIRWMDLNEKLQLHGFSTLDGGNSALA